MARGIAVTCELPHHLSLFSDRYDQTPRHLAAMFGHKSTEQLLALHEAHKLRCRAGTTANKVSRNYDAYLKSYEKLGWKERNSLSPIDRHDPERVTCKLMKAIRVQELWKKAHDVRVDFSGGEAREVKAAVMKELQTIIKKTAEEDTLYSGKVRLVGSSEDGSKIYCPDEFDVNVLFTGKDVEVEILETPEVLSKGKGTKTLSVVADAPGLQGNNLMDKLFLLLQTCLAEHTLQDKRLSFVPPGLSSTQVGAVLALAWQGKEYPLLLVGVDLVPVLELPWHDKITEPELMTSTPETFHVSNTADGSWRCSFALTEAEVLKGLSDSQRRVFIMGKVLLSCLKAEPWMPQAEKRHCTWFVNREWRIAVPTGFCYKNAFFDWLAKQEQVATEQDARYCTKALIAIFRQLCAVPDEVRGKLSQGRISAYFGGEFEGEKFGEGAHLIVRCLEEHLEEEQKGVKRRREENEIQERKKVCY
ncbi:uncharacterized protein LOC126992438 [Eriocheir sinensis]|uniref:uncharacterized protein LOC126992438 n=1 Tax=Eriocheir sinensis TaxID=95602 RepID=UPI0021CA263F|nr:uncharacterized protein LOC126992438 [Eriocheir sinensis]